MRKRFDKYLDKNDMNEEEHWDHVIGQSFDHINIQNKAKTSTVEDIVNDVGTFNIDGSNNWVIHGNYTESGLPYLANDPHLKNTAPAIWHQATVTDGEWSYGGLYIPGSPFMIIGTNQFTSIGITAMHADLVDLYKITFNKDRTKYKFGDKWLKTEVRYEEFKVKQIPSGYVIKKIKMESTHHGPLIRDDLNKAWKNLKRYPKGAFSDPETNLALRWVG